MSYISNNISNSSASVSRSSSDESVSRLIDTLGKINSGGKESQPAAKVEDTREQARMAFGEGKIYALV